MLYDCFLCCVAAYVLLCLTFISIISTTVCTYDSMVPYFFFLLTFVLFISGVPNFLFFVSIEVVDDCLGFVGECGTFCGRLC